MKYEEAESLGSTSMDIVESVVLSSPGRGHYDRARRGEKDRARLAQPVNWTLINPRYHYRPPLLIYNLDDCNVFRPRLCWGNRMGVHAKYARQASSFTAVAS